MGSISTPSACNLMHTGGLFNWNEFISDIIKGNYVLLIGSDILLEEGKVGTSDSSYAILKHIVNQHIGRGIISPNYQCTTFTDFSRDIIHSSREIRKLIVNALVGENRSYDCDTAEISSVLVELIRTKFFRTVLTTTFDTYLENLMREVWGNELKVMNITKTGKDFDYTDEEISATEFELKPTLYYVCGKAETSTRQFVATDDDAMDMVAKWLSKGPERFKKHITISKGLISLGCHFDDWLFRFFWYILRGSVNIMDSSIRDAVAVSGIGDGRNGLGAYLTSHDVHIEPNPREFMRKVVDGINMQKLTMMEGSRAAGGIFISYAHEDISLAFRVAQALEKKGYLVWFDAKKLDSGDEFDRRINNAINECRIFIPILSRQVVFDLTNSNERYYSKNEWNWAIDRYNAEVNVDGASRLKIKPLVVNEYDVDLPYHRNGVFANFNAFDLTKSPFSKFISNF